MKTINILLDRFKKIKAPDESIRKEFKKIILNKYGIEISYSKIKIQNSIIFFSAPSVLKNEILLDKREIIDKLNKTLKENIKNII